MQDSEWEKARQQLRGVLDLLLQQLQQGYGVGPGGVEVMFRPCDLRLPDVAVMVHVQALGVAWC